MTANPRFESFREVFAEIFRFLDGEQRSMPMTVAPSRGRGSKLLKRRLHPSVKASPPHGGVDRNCAAPTNARVRLPSPPHGGVDRNHLFGGWRFSLRVAPSRGRGSKHDKGCSSARLRWSPPHGGVDRNICMNAASPGAAGRPLTGAWIETFEDSFRDPPITSPPHGGVDRNFNRHGFGVNLTRRPLTGAWIETFRSNPRRIFNPRPQAA